MDSPTVHAIVPAAAALALFLTGCSPSSVDVLQTDVTIIEPAAGLVTGMPPVGGWDCLSGDCDEDGDGVPVGEDCDDDDPAIGAVLYQTSFDRDDGAFATTEQKPDPWRIGDGFASNTRGGQQALLHSATWADTVTFASVTADGAQVKCIQGDCETDRFRAGILARTSLDADQDEGFHGYRCAVARNIDGDCAGPGPFVQLAAFLDAPEDDLSAECGETCENPSFVELDREERSEATDVLGGDTARLAFWAVGSELVCSFEGADGERVETRATDDDFATGTTGLSTLHALAAFDGITVCEAFAVPDE